MNCSRSHWLLAVLLALGSASGAFPQEIFDDGFETGDTIRWSTREGDPTLPHLPPDPADVAPPLDLTVSTTIDAALEFLWNGPDPIQRGVAPGALEPRRIAGLRGRVLRVGGAPLPGARVSVHRAAEVGWTYSRADGVWDLAVNGGGPVTVVFEKDGYFPVHRTLPVDWHAWEELDAVVLIAADPVATPITAGATEMQVARGSLVEDDDGPRRATLLFPEGVQAEMVLPGGATVSLSALTVRATEYTVGPEGPSRMPAPLPENTGYTYAVELSADEAIAAGAVRVQFDQVLAFYLENFLEFPVGETVPVGYYDRELAAWVPSDDGRIVAVLTNDGTTVTLDIDGSGMPATPDDLGVLGVTPSELQRLAALYPAGSQLWRVPIKHFTPWDHNWPWGPPDDIDHPDDEPDPEEEPDPDPSSDPANHHPPTDEEPSESVDDPCAATGSILDCENQVLREEIPIVGAPWFLAYSSERVRDRGASVYKLPVVITGPTISSELLDVRVIVTIAGVRYEQFFPPAPNLRWTIQWDGRDRFGRPTQGTQLVTIRRDYGYRPRYYRTSEGLKRSFSRLPEGTYFSGMGNTRRMVVSLRTLSTISRRVRAFGNFDVSREGLGGWTLSPHHRYDLAAETVLRGDGTRHGGRRIGPLARRFAGRGEWADDGDGGPAVDAGLAVPRGLAVGPDGSVYIADEMAHRVRRVRPDGIIEAFAGSGEPCASGPPPIRSVDTADCGDGGPATEARLNGPRDVAVTADGRVLVADTANGCVREIRNGTIQTLMGVCAGGGGPHRPREGQECSSGCWSPDLPLDAPIGLETTPGGIVFVVDEGARRIWQLDPGGWATPLAGTGDYGDEGDGGPALLATFSGPAAIALGSDGSLIVADREANRVRRIRPSGLIEAFAGNGSPTSSGDGGAALAAGIPGPAALALGGDGSLYLVEEWGFGVRRVSPNGTISRVAGTDLLLGENLEAGMAPEQYAFAAPGGLAAMPDGDLLLGDAGLGVVLRVSHELPPWAEEEIRVLDGGQVLVFDPRGRHLRTLHALTGASLLEFAYDSAGKLVEVSDTEGNTTSLVRDTEGRVSTIIGPFGQSTVLSYDPFGYVAAVEDPAGNRWEMTSTVGGLLASFATPEAHAWSFLWAADGRLLRDEDPAGGWQELTRYALRSGQSGRAFAVRRTTPHGRRHEYQVWESPGQRTRFHLRGIDGSGLFRQASSSRLRADGSFESRRTGQGESFGYRGPDAQWGALAEHGVTSHLVRGPSALAVERSSEALLADPRDPMSLQSRTDRVHVNGRLHVSHYDALARRLLRTSPTGRETLLELDLLGRPTRSGIGGLLPTDLEYDGRGRLALIRQGSGTDERRLELFYDPLGRLERIADPLDREVVFSYDDANRIVTQQLPGGRTIGFAWDANGNLAGLAPPGRPSHDFAHTPVDQVEAYAPPFVPGAGATGYDYDLGRYLTEITRPDGATILFRRDIQGRLDRITTPRGLYEISYDPLSTDRRPLAMSDPDGGAITYAWSGPFPLTTTWTGPVAGSVSRQVDLNGWLVGQQVNNLDAATFAYDDDGLLTAAGGMTLARDAATGLLTGTSIGVVTTSYGYNPFGELVASSAAVSGVPVWEVSYVRDKLGRIVAKTETIQGETAGYVYRYDSAGRLEEVERDGVVTASYTYDANGNRLAKTTPEGDGDGHLRRPGPDDELRRGELHLHRQRRAPRTGRTGGDDRLRVRRARQPPQRVAARRHRDRLPRRRPPPPDRPQGGRHPRARLALGEPACPRRRARRRRAGREPLRPRHPRQRPGPDPARRGDLPPPHRPPRQPAPRDRHRHRRRRPAHRLRRVGRRPPRHEPGLAAVWIWRGDVRHGYRAGALRLAGLRSSHRKVDEQGSDPLRRRRCKYLLVFLCQPCQQQRPSRPLTRLLLQSIARLLAPGGGELPGHERGHSGSPGTSRTDTSHILRNGSSDGNDHLVQLGFIRISRCDDGRGNFHGLGNGGSCWLHSGCQLRRCRTCF
ncbi:MAG: hypothetical protein M5U13_11295 [Thermoanaerobaculia bacterium]|nr:hypothetical protein [Thermoanaerobaculia bacterium]